MRLFILQLWILNEHLWFTDACRRQESEAREYTVSFCLVADVINLFDDGAGAATGRRVTDLLVSKMQFGAQTSVSQTQQTLTSRLVKRGRDRLSPPKGKQVCAI